MDQREHEGENYGGDLHQHLHTFFNGHSSEIETFDRGPINQLITGFHVLRVDPGPKTGKVWAYISVGCGTLEVEGARHLEFLIIGDKPRRRFVELLAMTCHYHAGNILDVGHTLPVGEPWVRSATVDHILVSLPYTLGSEFEVFSKDGSHAHILWLIPVTETEVAFKKEHGLEALESRFEEAGVPYWDLKRQPVV